MDESRPFSVFMSTAMLRLFRLALRKDGAEAGRRKGRPAAVFRHLARRFSTLMMSAPRSPRYWAPQWTGQDFRQVEHAYASQGF